LPDFDQQGGRFGQRFFLSFRLRFQLPDFPALLADLFSIVARAFGFIGLVALGAPGLNLIRIKPFLAAVGIRNAPEAQLKCRLFLKKIIGIDPLYRKGVHGRHADVMLDHQLGQLFAVDEDHLALDLFGILDGFR